MTTTRTIYILGSGAIGFPLAAYLAAAGRSAIAVRTSRGDVAPGTVTITVQSGPHRITAPVETISLAQMSHLDGTIVVAAKSYANTAIAQTLQNIGATGPVVVMQNGIGVEQPFIEAQFAEIYRCVLYITSQARSENEFSMRPVTASPIGIVKGDEAGLAQCVEALTTDHFPFRAEANIQREIWKKAIINAVFNSICPLLDVDNGVFVRDHTAASLAREIVRECVTLTDRLGLGLSEGELMDQLLLISQRSDGQLISTLQDIRSGRPTEIEFLNREIARIAAAMQPPLSLPRVELLGNMIVAKAAHGRTNQS
jgi:2-dehydropantoate 2-reductase